MAYIGIAATEWGKNMRENIKWKKITNIHGVFGYDLYLNEKLLATVTKSATKKGWFCDVINPAIGGGEIYPVKKTLAEAKAYCLRYTNLAQFYRKSEKKSAWDGPYY